MFRINPNEPEPFQPIPKWYNFLIVYDPLILPSSGIYVHKKDACVHKSVPHHTWKNLCHNLSKANEPGLKNMKAILGFFGLIDGVFNIFLITIRDAISSSLSCLSGGGSQLEMVLQLEEENI